MTKEHKFLIFRLINEGAFDECIEDIKKDIYQEIYLSKPEETKKRDGLYFTLKALERIETNFNAIAQQEDYTQ